MKATQIPFVFGRVVGSPHFINREAELARLTSNLASGLNTILISPRRWGKSSLVRKAISELSSHKKVKVCMLDLFNIRTEKEFYEVFAREVLKSTSSKWEEWIENGKKFLSHISPRFNVGVDPTQDFSVSLEVTPESKNQNEILQLPEAIAKSKKLKIIVCIDEFQNLSYYDDPLAFQKQLRSTWQLHNHVAYCLYGSKRHMITELFENKSMPFYKFGDVMFLEKISTPHWKEYISQSFRNSGKSINDEDAGSIAERVRNHPYFVQQLAQKVWVMTGKKASADTVKAATESLLHENAILYQREVENLSNTQINFLRAICDGVEQLSAAESLKNYNLGTSANVLKIKTALEHKEVLDFMGPYPEFIDPLFELWLKKIYFRDYKRDDSTSS